MRYLNVFLRHANSRNIESAIVNYHVHLEEFFQELPQDMQKFLDGISPKGSTLLDCRHDSFRNQLILTIQQENICYYLSYKLVCRLDSETRQPLVRTMGQILGTYWQGDEVERKSKNHFVHWIALNNHYLLSIPFNEFHYDHEPLLPEDTPQRKCI